MIGTPSPTSLDVRFAMFGIPVSISPFFWLVGAFLAYSFAFDKQANQLDMIAFPTAILAILISILVHEFGHALVIRYVYGAAPVVILHGLGGLTVHDRPYYYRTPKRFGRIFISFAGPLAGFLLSGLCVWLLFFTDFISRESYLAQFLWFLSFIGIFWGIFNLMPVYPLDGGQIFREICEAVSPRHGVQFSAGVSVVIAALIALFFLSRGEFIIGLLFGFLAYQNLQTMQSRRF